MSIGDRVALAALALALAAIGLGGWLFLADGLAEGPPAEAVDPFGGFSSAPSAAASDLLVVDVEGSVLRPGIVELPAGSRVADALAAAGGYSADADLAAAAAQVNLAAPPRDGQQIVVPAIGAAAGASGSAAGGRLVNLNTASPPLPGEHMNGRGVVYMTQGRLPPCPSALSRRRSAHGGKAWNRQTSLRVQPCGSGSRSTQSCLALLRSSALRQAS